MNHFRRQPVSMIDTDLSDAELELAICVIRSKMRIIHASDRLTVMQRISEGYCKHCGTDRLPCHCENDE